MEFKLIRGSTQFVLPVPPSEFEVDTGNNTQTVDIYNLGEVNLGSRQRLTTISFSSFFPCRDYPFLAYHNIMEPLKTVLMIENWRKSGEGIKLIVTGTSINEFFTIEEFKYKWEAGTGDIGFTLNLKQCLEYTQLKSSSASTSKYSVNNPNYTRPSKKGATKNTYIVKKGDTLTSISKKFYGTTTKWRYLADKNNIKNPDKIYVGQKLVI